MVDIGHGASLTFSSFTAEIISISGFSIAQDAVETTHLLSTSKFREFIRGLKDAGEVSIEVNFDPDTDVPLDTTATLTITWPLPSGASSAATWAATANLTAYEPDAPVDDRMTASVTFKLSGVPTFTDSA